MLIIAKTNKTIQYTLTDTNTTLERCFAEIGFDISIAKEPTSIRNFIQSKIFDLLIIDWKFERNIVAYRAAFQRYSKCKEYLMYSLQYSRSFRYAFGKIFMSTVFSGSNFSDRDIFKLVTPLYNRKIQRMCKNMQSSPCRVTLLTVIFWSTAIH